VAYVAAHGATIRFLAGTSILFFDGVGKIFPVVYASQSPFVAHIRPRHIQPLGHARQGPVLTRV
jgi:hypothetical protein